MKTWHYESSGTGPQIRLDAKHTPNKNEWKMARHLQGFIPDAYHTAPYDPTWPQVAPRVHLLSFRVLILFPACGGMTGHMHCNCTFCTFFTCSTCTDDAPHGSVESCWV